MPNWCSNSLHIQGDSAQRREFLERVTTKDENGNTVYAILANLYPTPDDLRITSTFVSAEPNPKWLEWVADGTWSQAEYDERVARDASIYAEQQANIAKHGYKDWYDWCVDKWGTKWGDCDTELMNDENGSLDFTFQSAWSPPVDGIIHISTMFPDLVFMMSWYEEGMDFYGGMAVKNGQHKLNEGEITKLPDYTEVDWDDDNAHEAFDTVQEAISEAREYCELKAVEELGVKL